MHKVKWPYFLKECSIDTILNYITANVLPLHALLTH